MKPAENYLLASIISDWSVCKWLTTLIICLWSWQLPAASPGLSAGLDLVSRYQWRGLVLSGSPAVQPFLELQTGGFVMGAWGSASLQADDWQETDLYVGYRLGSFSLMVFDYFMYREQDQEDFFNYHPDRSAHVLELIASYEGSDKLPLRLLAGWNFYGADPDRSLYGEAAWMGQSGNLDWELFAGYTPSRGYYHEDRKGFTHAGASLGREWSLQGSSGITLSMQSSVSYSFLLRKMLMHASVGIAI